MSYTFQKTYPKLRILSQTGRWEFGDLVRVSDRSLYDAIKQNSFPTMRFGETQNGSDTHGTVAPGKTGPRTLLMPELHCERWQYGVTRCATLRWFTVLRSSRQGAIRRIGDGAGWRKSHPSEQRSKRNSVML
jgi:hypothetical protein